MTPAAVHATPLAPQSADSPHRWYSPDEYGRAFGGGKAAHVARLRWVEKLPDEQKQAPCADNGGVWMVRGDAVLPESTPFGGVDLTVFVQRAGKRAFSDTILHRPKALKNQIAGELALGLLTTFCAERGQAISFSDDVLIEFARVHGGRLRELGLPTGRCCLRTKLRRAQRGEQVDQRIGRSGRKLLVRDPRLVARVREVLLMPGTESGRLQLAFEEQQREAANLKVAPLSYHQTRLLWKELPKPLVILAREGPRAFEAKAVPKEKIDWSGVAAGDFVESDCRVADAPIRVPDGLGGWKAARPTVAVVTCNRSTLMEADVGVSENAILICRVHRGWFATHGLPIDAKHDHGKAFNRASGKKARAFWRRIGIEPTALGMFDQLGIRRQQPPARWPWAKKIESILRLLKKRCDRWYRAFLGGATHERSEAARELMQRDVMSLPTLDEFRDALQEAVRTINATPRRALGNKSPRQVFEEQRGVIRRAAPELLEYACRPVDGPVRVGRDGLTYKGVFYALDVHDQVKLAGKDVFVRPDLDCVGKITLTDERNNLLANAEQRTLIAAGASHDDARRALARKGRFRRDVRRMHTAAEAMTNTTTTQILREQRAHAESMDAERRSRSPAAEAPAVSIVLPAASVAAQTFDRKTKAARRPFVPASNAPRSGFEALAASSAESAPQDAGRPTVNPWDLYPEVEQPPAEPVDGFDCGSFYTGSAG